MPIAPRSPLFFFSPSFLRAPPFFSFPYARARRELGDSLDPTARSLSPLSFFPFSKVFLFFPPAMTSGEVSAASSFPSFLLLYRCALSGR